MIKVVSTEQMRAIEAAADSTGVIAYDAMMENAGRVVARRALQLLAERFGTAETFVTVLAGPGNNGGDGLVAARVLHEEGKANVRVYSLRRPDEANPLVGALRQAGIFIANAEDDQRYRVLTNMIGSAQIVIDALFGIGTQPPLRDDAAKLLRAVGAALSEVDVTDDDSVSLAAVLPQHGTQRRRPFILAVDCPSGLNCDTGELDRHTLHADETITFVAAKPGLLSAPGLEAVGMLQVARIGIPDSIDGLKGEKRTLVDAETIRMLLPARRVNSHKGTFGRALIVGGSLNYVGAPGLAGLAAYRVGAGLVSIAAPPGVVGALAGQLLEATWITLPHDMGVIAAGAAAMLREEAASAQAVLIGPGMNHEQTTREMLTQFLDGTRAITGRRGIGFVAGASSSGATLERPALPPLVIDADGLNLLTEIDQWWSLLPAETIITPHPGEMARLAGVTTADVQANRWQIAAEKAAEWNVILVLKGAHTLIAAPDGRVSALPFKTSALAKAGTGDVLAGMIVGLLAQGMKPYDAARSAAYLHGLAGTEHARAAERGLLASELVTSIEAALARLEGGR